MVHDFKLNENGKIDVYYECKRAGIDVTLLKIQEMDTIISIITDDVTAYEVKRNVLFNGMTDIIKIKNNKKFCESLEAVYDNDILESRLHDAYHEVDSIGEDLINVFTGKKVEWDDNTYSYKETGLLLDNYKMDDDK